MVEEGAVLHEHGLAELHVHIEGTFEPELIFALAERNRIELPYRDLDDLRGRYEFGDLASFLDLYYANMEVLRTAEDFADLARAYFARAAQAGITRAEFFFDPQAHTARGVELREVVDGLADAAAGARSEYGIDAAMIASIVRDRPVAEANDTFTDLMKMQARSSPSDSTRRRSDTRRRCSRMCSPVPAQRVCTSRRTRGRRDLRSMSGRHWIYSAPSASTTASGPSKIRNSSHGWWTNRFR